MPLASVPVTVIWPEVFTDRPLSLEAVKVTGPRVSLVVIEEATAPSPVVVTVWVAGEIWVIVTVVEVALDTLTVLVRELLLTKSPSVSVNWALAL